LARKKKKESRKVKFSSRRSSVSILTYIEGEMRTLPHQAQTKAQQQCGIRFEDIGHVSHKGHFVPVKKLISNILKKMVPLGRNNLAK